jgi:hypothetical protein
MGPSPLRVIALCACVLGVFFLAKSIVVKSPKYMLHELLRFKVNKSRFFRAYIGQKLDAIIGFVFLLLGFGIQIYLEVEGLRDQPGNQYGLDNWMLVIAVTVGASAAIVYLLGRITRYFSGKIFVELVRFMVETHRYPLASDESLVLEVGRILRVRREEEDTVESYTRRVLDRMKMPAAPAETRPGRRSAL